MSGSGTRVGTRHGWFENGIPSFRQGWSGGGTYAKYGVDHHPRQTDTRTSTHEVANGSRQVTRSNSSSERDIRDDGIHHFSSGRVMCRFIIVHGSTAVTQRRSTRRRDTCTAVVTRPIRILTIKRGRLIQLPRVRSHPRVGVLSLQRRRRSARSHPHAMLRGVVRVWKLVQRTGRDRRRMLIFLLLVLLVLLLLSYLLILHCLMRRRSRCEIGQHLRIFEQSRILMFRVHS